MDPKQTPPTPPATGDVPVPETPDQPVAGQTFGPSAPAPSVSVPESMSTPVPSGESPTAPLAITPHNRSKKGLIIGLICAVAILLISGAAYASYYYYQTTKPENVLIQAFANTFDREKAKTIHFSGEVSASDKALNMNAGAEFTGAVDTQKRAFDVSGTVDAVVANINFDFRTTDSKTFYARVGGLEGLPQLLGLGDGAAYYATLIDALNDQWIEINESLIKQVYSSYEAEGPSDADLKKVFEIYLNNPFLIVKETLSNETIKGQNSYHYKVVIDGTMLKKFVTAINEAKISGLKATKAQLDEFNAEVDKGQLDKYPFEIWISKADKMITQFSVTVKEDRTTSKFRVTMDSYNKPVKVEEPEGAKSILDLMGGFFGGGFDPTQMTVPVTLPNGISL
jgi:hypothetical protein